jgi:hypothetical protein
MVKTMDIEFESNVIAYDSVMSLADDAITALDYKNRENVKIGEDTTTISLVGYSDTMEELIKAVCLLSSIKEFDFVMDFINLDSIDYEDVYVASLVFEDGDIHFNIEKALDEDDNYPMLQCDKLYLDIDCPEEIIASSVMYETDVEYFMCDYDLDSNE